MLPITDKRNDEIIRKALNKLSEDQLEVLSAVCGIIGGKERLIEIRTGIEEIPINERSILICHMD